MQKALDAEELAEFAVEGADADFAGVGVAALCCMSRHACCMRCHTGFAPA